MRRRMVRTLVLVVYYIVLSNVNPYVVVQVENEAQETTVLPGQYTPLWNDEYVLYAVVNITNDY